MILFKHKNVLPALVAVLAAASLAACVQPPVREEPARPEAETVPAETTAESVAVEQPASAGVPGETLDAPLLYDMLLAEIAGQRGVLNVSGTSYLKAARQSEDPRIAERAFKISVYAKQPQLALESARRWVELAPDNLEARQSLAALAMRTGQSDEALEQFASVVERERAAGQDDPYQSVLVLLAREPDKDRSLQIMAQLAAGNDGDPQAHFAHARLAVHFQEWPLAEQEVARALELRPDWTPALILNAQISLKQGKTVLARRQLESALERKPADAELRMAYARLLVDVEDFDAARTEYRKLLKLEPDNGQIVYSLALLSLESGQLDDARTLFEKLLKLEFQEQQAYYYLGAIDEERGKPGRAMQWYDKVGKGDHWLEVQIRMARIDAQSGNVSAARERLRKVRLANPAETQRMFLVEGEILSQIGRDEDAYTLYSQYLELQPDDLEILYARALVAERLDLLVQAESDFRRVLAIDPDNARTLNALGYTLADRTDRYQEALGYVERALVQTPDDPAVIDSMGWVLYRVGRLQEAREHLQRAYDMTKDSEIAAHLGEVMWAMGDREQARALWEAARKAGPKDDVLEETIRRHSR